MVEWPDQGDIVTVSDIRYPLLVVSSRFFNESGRIIACPILKETEEGPLHIPLESQTVSGFVICEQMRYFNLQRRSFRPGGRISFYQLMDISDAIQGIFEYI